MLLSGWISCCPGTRPRHMRLSFQNQGWIIGKKENMDSSGVLPQHSARAFLFILGSTLRIFNTALQIVLFCVFIIYSVCQLLHWPTHFSRTTSCSSSILLLHPLAKVLRGKNQSTFQDSESRENQEENQEESCIMKKKNHINPITVRTKMSFLIARCEATWCTGRNDSGWGVRKLISLVSFVTWGRLLSLSGPHSFFPKK